MNGFKEQEKAGEDADKDTAGLSNTLCALRVDVISDDVDNDWTEFTRDRRSGKNRTAENRVDVVDETKTLEFLMNRLCSGES